MKKRLIFSVITIILVIGTVFAVAAASFVDVPEDAYYAKAAERMAERGILSGYGDGYY